MIRNAIGLLALCLAAQGVAGAEREISFGVGVGALHGGIGLNVASRSNRDLGYFAAGCMGAAYSDEHGWESACGVGAGWLWTGPVPQTGNRHALGVHIGSVGAEGNSADLDTVYGLGANYVYFRKGIDNGGMTLGITPAVGRHGDETKAYVIFQLGYQF